MEVPQPAVAAPLVERSGYVSRPEKVRDGVLPQEDVLEGRRKCPEQMVKAQAEDRECLLRPVHHLDHRQLKYANGLGGHRRPRQGRRHLQSSRRVQSRSAGLTEPSEQSEKSSQRVESWKCLRHAGIRIIV